MDISVTRAALDQFALGKIRDEQERAGAAELSARPDTVTLTASDGAGNLLGYVVAGFDDDDMVTIYQARAYAVGLGAIAIRAVIGAAQVIGAPVRVHAARLAPLMRMAGVTEALSCVDTDGLPMGVFNGK